MYLCSRFNLENVGEKKARARFYEHPKWQLEANINHITIITFAKGIVEINKSNKTHKYASYETTFTHASRMEHVSAVGRKGKKRASL